MTRDNRAEKKTIPQTVKEIEDRAYASFMRLYPHIPQGLDKEVRRPKLTRQLLDELGVRDEQMNNIMVTGSKGKGSLSVILASLLSAKDLRVGLFTSPHLQSFKERIRLDGKALSDDILLKAAGDWSLALERLDDSLDERTYIGPVGAAAVLAMAVYEKLATDYNIVELGRGARYDDVNQIIGRVGLINRVFVEHAELGKTLEEVAYNKAGIMKAGMDFVASGRQDKTVLRVLEEEARLKELSFYLLGRDFEVDGLESTSQSSRFNYLEGGKIVFKDVDLGLLGRHQADNAALALFTLRRLGLLSKDESWRRPLATLSWPGRLELIDRAPFTLLDGCISKACMQGVLDIFKQSKASPSVGVVGIPKEKDYLGVLRALSSVCDHVIMTHADNDYLKFSPDQFTQGKLVRADLVYLPQVPLACQRAQALATKEGKILYVGTQSMIKDVKTHYGQSTLDAF